MKKPKFLIKVNRNNMAKVYLNGKWHKDIARLSFEGIPHIYNIEIEQYKTNKEGVYYVENGEIARKVTKYTLGVDDNG